MPELVILTPTRGRAAQFARLVEAVSTTSAGDVSIHAGRDFDDPTNYNTLPGLRSPIVDPSVPRAVRRSLSAWTNALAERVLASPWPPAYLASLGDDHVPRTPAWDTILIDAIKAMGGTGIAYGNDLLQGRSLPTAWVMSADIVRTLGWVMLPTLEHMYVDNAILELGRAAGCITYRPDVVIEHMHPVAGKAEVDESYRSSNSAARMAADRRAFESWKADPAGLAADAAKVAALLAGAG
jgi:hypothetical protein